MDTEHPERLHRTNGKKMADDDLKSKAHHHHHQQHQQAHLHRLHNRNNKATTKQQPSTTAASITTSAASILSTQQQKLHQLPLRHSHHHQLQQQQQPLSPKTKEELRLRVNARERQRMHDMNSALDALRMAMPYAKGPSVKKLSKMNTLLLARNYILLLTKTTEDLRRMLTEAVSHGGSLAAWPAMADATLLLGSVQDVYDKQRRYAEELLLRQEQQLQQPVQSLEAYRSTGGKSERVTLPSPRSPLSPIMQTVVANDRTKCLSVLRNDIARHQILNEHKLAQKTFPLPASMPEFYGEYKYGQIGMKRRYDAIIDGTAASITSATARVENDDQMSLSDKLSDSETSHKKPLLKLEKVSSAVSSRQTNFKSLLSTLTSGEEKYKTNEKRRESKNSNDNGGGDDNDDDSDDKEDEVLVVDTPLSFEDVKSDNAGDDKHNSIVGDDDDDGDDGDDVRGESSKLKLIADQRVCHHVSRIKRSNGKRLSSSSSSSSSSSPPGHESDQLVTSTTMKPVCSVDAFAAGAAVVSRDVAKVESKPKPTLLQTDKLEKDIGQQKKLFPQQQPTLQHEHKQQNDDKDEERQNHYSNHSFLDKKQLNCFYNFSLLDHQRQFQAWSSRLNSTHLPYFIPSAHHHFHIPSPSPLAPLAHPLIPHPGFPATAARHLLVTSPLDAGHVIGSCPCHHCLAKASL